MSIGTPILSGLKSYLLVKLDVTVQQDAFYSHYNRKWRTLVATKTLKNQITGSIAIPLKKESSIFCGFNEPKIIGIGPVFQKL